MSKLVSLEQLSSSLTEFKKYIDSKMTTGGSSLVLGTGSENAYRGDYGDIAYTHSQSAHAPANAQPNSAITKAEIEAKLTGDITSHNHSGLYTPLSHTQNSHAPSNAQKNSDITKAEIEAKLTGAITSHTHSYASASHASDTTAHLTAAERTSWNNKSNLTLGTTSTTAFRGDYGNTAYNHSQATHAPSNAQKNSDITKAEIEAKLTGSLSSHTHEYLSLSGGTLKGRINMGGNYIVGETKFIDSATTTYTDPWNGTACAIKATGNIACTGGILANDDLETKSNLYTRGAATFDDFAYINSWNCDNENYGDFFGQGILYAKNDTASTSVTAYRDPYFAIDFCEYPTFTGSFFHLYLDYIVTGGHVVPYGSNSYDLGHSSLKWRTVYSNNSLNTSDRIEKENIVYIKNNDETETVSEISDITYNSLYNFVRDDLELATYNLKCDGEKPDINFIAQDLLYNIDGTNNTIGQIIVPPISAPTDEEAQKYEEVDEDGNKTCSPPTLSYDLGNYVSVLAGALKEAINEIELLKKEIKELKNK